MISEIKMQCRDMLKMDWLRDVMAGDVALSVRLDGGRAEDYASSLHREGSRVKVYGKFNLSENPTGDVLTVRPVAAGSRLQIDIKHRRKCSGRILRLVRAANKTVEKEWSLDDIEQLSLLPSGDGFTLRLTCRERFSSEVASSGGASLDGVSSGGASLDGASSEVASLDGASSGGASSRGASLDGTSLEDGFMEFGSLDDDFLGAAPIATTSTENPSSQNISMQNISVENVSGANVSVIKNSADKNSGEAVPQERPLQSEAEKRLIIAAETENDQSAYQAELEEMAACVEADAEVLAYYRDKDVRPTEELLQEIREKIAQTETQIRLLIEARQRKTAAIEAEIKNQKS